MTKILILALVFIVNWKLSCGIRLNCAFRVSATNYPFLGRIYKCDARISNYSENKHNVTEVSGTHESGRNHASVLGLDIINGNIEYFPRNIEQFFPNIKMLSFQHNSISYVINQHLIPHPNLVYLCLWNNTITSLERNVFSGLQSIRYIDFDLNNIKYVEHDFILPNTGTVDFRRNRCINLLAETASGITNVRSNLLMNCPQSIPQIEAAIEIRHNLLTNVSGQVQALVYRADNIEQNHSKLDNAVQNHANELADLYQRNLQLSNELIDLQVSSSQLTDDLVELQQSNFKLINEVTTLTDQVTALTDQITELNESNAQLGNEVTTLSDEVTDLQQSNLELTNRNLQLETRIGFVDSRAGFLEIRVAFLESIIESKLGLKLEETISEN